MISDDERVQPAPCPGVQDIGSARFVNRELSWLEFNQRVLDEARNPRHPLLERLKFIAISDSNLDEFLMVRVAGIQGQVEADVADLTPDGMTPRDELSAVQRRIRELLADQRRLLLDDILPRLAEAGVSIIRCEQADERQQAVLQQFFEREVFPVCTPLAIDPGHPFPFISNLSVNLAVRLHDAERGLQFARLKVPSVLPRLIPVPVEGKPHAYCFVWLEDLLVSNLQALFPGMRIVAAYPFRVLRDADIEIQEIEAADLLQTVQATLHQRRFGSAIALQVDSRMPAEIRTMLTERLGLDAEDVFIIDGPLGISALTELLAIDRPDLKDPPFVPRVPPALQNGSIFSAIRESDILLHHPFDSFSPVVDFICEAARDPNVLAIKQTLYRVGTNSPIVAALLEATQRGKQVAVLVELKARFDEENNIEWARSLEQAGVHVTYGLVGLKTHCKLALVVRRERDGITRYVHIGTGNYNPATARLYTDLGMFTAREEIGADVSDLFNFLTGYSRQRRYRHLLVAPVTLREELHAKIEREIERQRQHGDGRIILKMNALVDPAMIDQLYEASREGVEIDLIVRGICCLRPGVMGLSERIRVRSVIGRFLEHSRIYYFGNGGQEDLYIGSADLMPRNLDHRVEVLTPVFDPAIKRQIRQILNAYLEDTVQAYEISPSQSYQRLPGFADLRQPDLHRQLVNQAMADHDTVSAGALRHAVPPLRSPQD